MSEYKVYEFMKSVPGEYWMSTTAILEGLRAEGNGVLMTSIHRKLRSLIRFGFVESRAGRSGRSKYYRLRRPNVAYRILEHYSELVQMKLSEGQGGSIG